MSGECGHNSMRTRWSMCIQETDCHVLIDPTTIRPSLIDAHCNGLFEL